MDKKECTCSQDGCSEVLNGKTPNFQDEVPQGTRMDRNDSNVGVGNSANPQNSSSTTHGILHNTSVGTDAQVRINNHARINESVSKISLSLFYRDKYKI